MRGLGNDALQWLQRKVAEKKRRGRGGHSEKMFPDETDMTAYVNGNEVNFKALDQFAVDLMVMMMPDAMSSMAMGDDDRVRSAHIRLLGERNGEHLSTSAAARREKRKVGE